MDVARVSGYICNLGGGRMDGHAVGGFFFYFKQLEKQGYPLTIFTLFASSASTRADSHTL